MTESMRISHEAIYQALYVQGRGALKRELVACLRTGRALRVPRARTRNKAWAHATPRADAQRTPRRGWGPGQCQGTGKATWSSACNAQRSAPSSSGPPDSRC